MTSRRKRKKEAAARGLNTTELDLVELTEELLDAVKWLQVLGYANQYLVNQKLEVSEEERDKVLEAAARTVERDKRMHEWRDRLARIKQESLRIHPEVAKARRAIQAEAREAKQRARDDSGSDPAGGGGTGATADA